MNIKRTQGRIYSVGPESKKLMHALTDALSKENYVHWDSSLPGLYVPQTNEIQLVHHSELKDCFIVTMAMPGDIHKWGLLCSERAPEIPMFTAYLEPNGYWTIKCFLGGKPKWKSREELDHEVPYPVPLANTQTIGRSLEASSVLTAFQDDHGTGNQVLPEESGDLFSFLRFWGLPAQLPDDHRRRETIWLNKESPLVINRMKERA